MSQTRFSAIFGGFAGDHTLGSLTKETGVSISGGVITITPSAGAHRWKSRHLGSPPSWTGKVRADVWQFNLANGAGGAIGSAHYILRQVVGGGGDDYFSIKRTTSGDWEFRLGDAGLIYTHTPSGTHHIYWMFARETMFGSPLGGTATTAAAGAYTASQPYGWTAIYIDKVLVLARGFKHTSASIDMTNAAPTFGESATIAGVTKTFTVTDFCALSTDWEDPVGKLDVRQWGWHLAQTPINDSGTKSSGTDAAALIDEVPPAGSGTTDVDYYDVANAYQTSDLTDTLLGAGETLHGLIPKHWDRCSAFSGKSGNVYSILRDGTNLATQQMLSVSATTSYGENLAAGSLPFPRQTALDGAEWTAKTNTYLDLFEVGTYGATAGVTFRVDAIVVEVAIVASGDTVTAPPRFQVAPPRGLQGGE